MNPADSRTLGKAISVLNPDPETRIRIIETVPRLSSLRSAPKWLRDLVAEARRQAR